jgi:5'-nucleotidase
MKKRIAIDMDDVLADATGRFIEYAQERLNWHITREDLNGHHNWAGIMPDQESEIRSWLHEDGFFRGMQVMPDAQEVLEKLHDKYEIFIVSAAVEFPLSMKEKVEWMQEYFPFVDWRHLVFCGHKYMFKADYLIDDHERNLIAFCEGQPLVYTAPHNIYLTDYQRINNWREAAMFFEV